MSQGLPFVIDPRALRGELLRRGLSMEEMRKAVGISAPTIAKINRGVDVDQKVKARILRYLEEQPVLVAASALFPELDRKPDLAESA